MLAGMDLTRRPRKHAWAEPELKKAIQLNLIFGIALAGEKKAICVAAKIGLMAKFIEK